MVQLGDDWLHRTRNVREVGDPARFAADVALDVDRDVIRVPVKPCALVTDGGVGKTMSRLECELFEYLHLRYAEVLVRLKTQAPARMLEAVLDRERGVIHTRRPIHGLQEKVVEFEAFQVARVEANLGVD
jgi:hypothetical protein